MGTRGKSSVVRLVHAGLRGAGLTVLGKTTGSRPSLLLPDGTEEEIKRRGPASILEQRKTLRRASQYGVDAYVIEAMSINPEYQRVEARSILEPTIVGVTRLALDHLSEMGDSLEDIANSIADSIPSEARVIIGDENLEKYASPSLERLESGRPDTAGVKEVSDSLDYLEFDENIQLSLALASEVAESSESVVSGMCKTVPDPGSLRAWTIGDTGHCGQLIVVNGFAANEPNSTERVLAKVLDWLDFESGSLSGLLNLRADRGRRTLQWRDALAKGRFDEFDRVYVIGDQAEKFKSMLRGKFPVRVLKFAGPESLMEKLSEQASNREVVFGFGNIGGAGRELVSFWSEQGEPL